MSYYLSSISEAVINNRAIAFLGAGCSMPSKDPISGIFCAGLPGASQLLKIMAKEKPYITTDLAFNQACYMYQSSEGKQNLIKFLELHLKQDIEPLPTHKYLASLPIRIYISYNFDMLLEKALRQRGKKFRIILDDNDISLLRDDEIAVIKPHGCFSKPDKIIASIDDEIPFNEKFPLVDCFLKSNLASRTVIYIGFSLSDNDFKNIHLHIQRQLNELSPKSYAIFLHPDPFQISYWESKKVKVIDDDAGVFLKKIVDDISKKKAIDLNDIEKEDWFSHPFFIHLQKIKNLPTETQLIDAFLDKIIEEVSLNKIAINDLITFAEDGRKKVLDKKPNFEAFAKASTEMIKCLKDATSISDAENELLEYKEKREEITKKIRKKHKSIIKSNDSILLFSQSKRVTQLLSAVPVALQKSCKLYIGECRPKSPGFSFFQDAIETIQHIEKNNFELIFYPDIILGHLFSEKLITKVILGAHTIYTDKSGNMTHFVNTSGSLVISKFCEIYDIPLYVIAESDKEMPSSNLKLKKISTTQEVKLDDSSTNELLKKIKQEGKDIKIMNVGYDLIPVNSKTFYVNEI